MSTLLVEYVGLKPQETDCVAGTGITWVGLGAVREVPAKAWEIMSKHPDVWKLVVKAPEPALGLADAKPAPLVDADELDDATLKAKAAAAGIKVDGRLKGEKLRAAIAAAAKE